MKNIDPNEYVVSKRPPFGLRWLWRLVGGESVNPGGSWWM